MHVSRRLIVTSVATFAIGLAACSPADPASSGQPGAEEDATVTVYSGRSEELVGPLLEQFTDETGIEVEARYGDTAEMANLILTEGENSPADVFFAQDAGALGAVAAEGLLSTLPDETLDLVDARFRSPSGEWVGVSGRARVVVYNTDALSEADLPDSIFGFTDPEWSGRIGWAPTNGSFQSFVTALRVIEGEDRAREWLEGIEANDPSVYEGNNPALDAVIAGEIDVAFINHYYLMQRLVEDPDAPAANYFLTDGDPGALVNVAGAGVLTTATNDEAARELVDFLLSTQAQEYFASETKEYPLVGGVEADAELPALESIGTPEIDLSDLSDLEGTLELLQEAGIL
ncbi:MAG TPA: iron ABC transporter substrate-binding protein [Patescibacteria group bacterium]|nr:iron ABC transporter substrate-binding protein [Patescibacteria group bacterium]